MKKAKPAKGGRSGGECVCVCVCVGGGGLEKTNWISHCISPFTWTESEQEPEDLCDSIQGSISVINVAYMYNREPDEPQSYVLLQSFLEEFKETRSW